MSRFRIAVHITPRRGILDPQGKAVADALHTLGFAGVHDVHVGRHVVVELDADDRKRRRAVDARDVRAAARESGHRRLRDRERGATRSMKFGIVTFPGSNCDYDAYRAVVDELGEEAIYLWHKDHDLQGSDVDRSCRAASATATICAPARSRASARSCTRSIAYAKRGGPVIGICNGFQIACEAGLLPGALLRNASLKYVCEPIRLRVEID